MLRAFYHNLGVGVFCAVVFSILSMSAPLSAFGEDAATASEEKEVTITGSIEKAAIDEKGAVIAVEIWVEQGDAYDYFLVNDSPKGNELLGHVGSRTTLSGILEEDEDGNKIVTVKSFAIVK
ncbi:MAG: hypothetical protein HY280_00745 [Nitrospinae bacterium]|nr:hypothetical protein [Nitrospinota bacterium]